MENLIQDVRLGARRLAGSPVFTAVAIISLALGVGANTAIFSLVNTVLFRPLPVEKPEQIVSVAVRGKGDSMLSFSYPNYEDFRDRNEVLSGLIVHRFAPLSLSRGGVNERVWGYLVSGNYFDVLGVKPIKGRTFLPEEGTERLAHPVVVISHGCWVRRFGADPDVIDREILINSKPFRIIGVMPEEFKGTELIYTPEIWAPMMMLEWLEPGSDWIKDRSTQNSFAIGRLKEGVSVEQAEASLNILATQLGTEYPDDNEGQVIRLTPPGFVLPDVRDPVVSFSWILMGAVGLVLMIACANLASLLLARVTERRREIAVRLALGAKRIRLVRQLLTESLLLSMSGGLAGVLLAMWIVDVLVAFKPPVDFPLTVELAIDLRVIAFSIIVSMLTGIVFGLAPALQATRTDLVTTLKDTSAAAGYRRSRLRSSLVVAQIGLSVVLLIGAGLVVRTLNQLQTMSPGFQTTNRMMMSVDLGLQGYDRTRGQQFYKQLVERVEALPGVRSAAMTTYVPLSLNYNGSNLFIEGQPPERGANIPSTMVGSAGLGYFETMGINLLVGRDFNEQDDPKSERVLIVNEALARHFFPGPELESAVGKRISISGPTGPFRPIVGVVENGKYFNIGEDQRFFVYSFMNQSYGSNGTLLVHTEGDPVSITGAVRNEISSLDPNLPIFDIKTVAEHMNLSFFPTRVAATVLAGFGLLALVLAGIGVYGVTSYSVAQRKRDISIRMALGARSGQVIRLVLREGVRLAVIGVVIGLGGAFALTGLASSLLYGVSATDPLTFSFIAFLLGGVSVAACVIPARRATKIDPIRALKCE